MHFMKTGGSSIADLGERGYYKFFNYTSKMIKERISRGEDCIGNNTLLQTHSTRVDLKGFGMLKGSTIFTFFRDPKERYISEYYYMKRNERTKGRGLLSWLQGEYSERRRCGLYLDVLQVSQEQRDFLDKLSKCDVPEHNVKEAIKFLEEFEFIGFMDHYDKDFIDLCDFLYVPRVSQVPRRNVTKSEEKIVITPEIECELDRLTKYDYIIYEAAKEVAARKRKECKKYGNGVCRMRIK